MQQSSHFNIYQVFTKYYYDMKKMDKKPYPGMRRSTAVLYWMGIFFRAARAKAFSFSKVVTFLDIIAVTLTNYKQRRHFKSQCMLNYIQLIWNDTEKLHGIQS